ncbi:alpha,alpha-trehalase TreF [Chelativorans sp.]|uniref:alpha,alpha-trehalase TreF n=1 Tax=Chelativorans sp. TaxID=2203393 RepID=UPI0028123402|nr:alpha,alpha-trehalase TreF [Chelativorans sp.]
MVPPSLLFPELYNCVGSSGLFKRMKPFADAIPLDSPENILTQFRDDPPRTDDQLRAFVGRWFEIPSDALPQVNEQELLPLRAHIETRWDQATTDARNAAANSSLIPVPGRFITSGGMWREQYYWNTYFLMIGLGAQRIALQSEMAENIAHLIDRFGYAPNGNRTYYLSRSQPPLFYKMAGLLAPEDETEAFVKYLPQLRKEHTYWMCGEGALRPGEAYRHAVMMPDGSILNRYWDDRDTPRDEAYFRDLSIAAASARPERELFRDIRAGAESGWDFSSRWFADGMTMASIATTSIIPTDLNAFLYGLERAIQQGCERTGDRKGGAEFEERADLRRAAMNAWLWNEALGLFDDYDWMVNQKRNAVTAAAFAPLFARLATPEQATRTAHRVRASLLVTGGLTSTDRSTGEQWDAPYGFAAMQWIGVVGLREYGIEALAKEIARRWLHTVAGVYLETGRLFEKYDLVAARAGGGGGYPVQSGQGWTASVTAALMDLYPEYSRLGDVAPAPAILPPA